MKINKLKIKDKQINYRIKIGNKVLKSLKELGEYIGIEIRIRGYYLAFREKSGINAVYFSRIIKGELKDIKYYAYCLDVLGVKYIIKTIITSENEKND